MHYYPVATFFELNDMISKCSLDWPNCTLDSRNPYQEDLQEDPDANIPDENNTKICDINDTYYCECIAITPEDFFLCGEARNF